MIKSSIKNKAFFIFIALCLMFTFGCSKQSTKTTKSQNINASNSSVNNTNIKEKKDSALEKQYLSAYNLFFQHKYEEAIKISDNIIKGNENFYKAYNIKGIALCFKNDFANGMKNIDKCLNIKPDFGYGRFNKALAYELYGHYDDALKWYDKALEIENYVWSYYGKASIYGRLGDVDNTVKYLKIAINMDPTIKECVKTERDFDPVRDDSKFKALVK